MHVLSNSRGLRILLPLGAVLAFAVAMLINAIMRPQAAPPSEPPLPVGLRPAAPVASTAPQPSPAPRRALETTSRAHATTAQEPATAQEPPVEYRLNEEARSEGGRRLLATLMDDPWIRMDPDQRSRFLAAWHRAAVAYNAEMNRAFAVDAQLAGRPEAERAAARDAIEEEARRTLGTRLAEELAVFLSPEQMRQLRGRVAFDSVLGAFFRSDAIAEVR
jgi:hypothetical protein